MHLFDMMANMRRALAAPLMVALQLAVAINCLPHPAMAQQQNEFAGAEPQPGPITFTAPPSSQGEATDQLRRIIEADYAYWTGGKEKPLTIWQIGRLQRNPSVRGGQAVLLGVLALTIDHAHGFIDRLSYDSVMELAGGAKIMVKTSPALAGNAPDLNEPETFKFLNVVRNYHKLFDNLVSNTTPEGFKLWGRANGPTIDGLQQGPVGDCYWIAAVEAVVVKRPDVVARAIRQIGPNRFELNLLGYEQPIAVTLTDGQMCQLNLDPHEGCWLTLLALGEAHIRDRFSDIVDFWRATPLGVVAHSGSQLKVLESLLGCQYESLHLRRTARQDVRLMLENAMRENMPVGLTTGDHCLSVCNYNAQTEMLRVLNPWGTSGKYTIEGTDLSVDMNRGMFDISLADACRSFLTINLPRAVVRGAD